MTDGPAEAKRKKKRKDKKYNVKFRVQGDTYEEMLHSFNRQLAVSFCKSHADTDTNEPMKRLRKVVKQMNTSLGRAKSGGADLIYADPPWRYAHSGNQGATTYQTMTTPEICAMDLRSIVGENTNLLLLWATAPKWNDAIAVMDAWGFEYVTVFICWVKRYRSGRAFLGIGHHTRANTEYLLLGRRRGVSITHVYNQDVRRVFSQVLETQYPETIDSLIGRHSEKPAEVRSSLERLFPAAGCPVKVEMFSRHRVDEWISFGNEQGSMDNNKITEYYKGTKRARV
jgi:N6-adenosine-specific RNA methylase IME4